MAEQRKRFADLLRPVGLRDYGLSFAEDEMRADPDGRDFLAEIKRAERTARKDCELFRRLGTSAAATADDIAMQVLNGNM